jgi:hypothetical protein
MFLDSIAYFLKKFHAPFPSRPNLTSRSNRETSKTGPFTGIGLPVLLLQFSFNSPPSFVPGDPRAGNVSFSITSAHTGGGNNTFSQRAARKFLRISGARSFLLSRGKTIMVFPRRRMRI